MHSVLDLLLTEVQPTLSCRRGIIHLRHEVVRLGAVCWPRACIFTAVTLVVACTLAIGLILFVVFLASRALGRALHRSGTATITARVAWCRAGGLSSYHGCHALDDRPPRCHFFLASFYHKLRHSEYARDGVKKWTKRVDVFAKDLLICPIHCHGNHWTLAVVNLLDKRFEYFDSLSVRRLPRRRAAPRHTPHAVPAQECAVPEPSRAGHRRAPPRTAAPHRCPLDTPPCPHHPTHRPRVAQLARVHRRGVGAPLLFQRAH